MVENDQQMMTLMDEGNKVGLKLFLYDGSVLMEGPDSRVHEHE